MSERTTAATKRMRELSGEAKLPGAAALFGVTAGAAGKAGSDRSNEQSVEKKTVREHTVASHFKLLRDALYEAGSVRRLSADSDLSDVAAGETVEIAGRIDAPPLELVIKLFDDLLPFIDDGEGEEEAIKISRAKRRNLSAEDKAALDEAERQQEESRQEREAQRAANKELLRIVDLVRRETEGSKLVDLVLRTDRASVLIAADREYITEATRAQLVRGTFSVVGIVTATASTDDAVGVSSSRNGVIGAIAENALRPNILEIQQSFASQGVVLDIPSTHIQGPYIQVIPLAIFAGL